MSRPLLARQPEAMLERRARAWELRKAGAGYRAIGRELGVSRDTAHKDVRHVFQHLVAKTQESAEQARQIDSERLDSWLLALAPKLREGHLGAIERGIKILERRAKMFGYDAPTQVEVSATVADVTSEEMRERVREKLLRLADGLPVIEVQPVVPQLGEAGGNGHGSSAAST